MMKAQASAPVNLSDNVRREKQEVGGLQTRARWVKFVGQAFLPAALSSQGKRERLPLQLLSNVIVAW
jgi:hypothetical protein